MMKSSLVVVSKSWNYDTFYYYSGIPCILCSHLYCFCHIFYYFSICFPIIFSLCYFEYWCILNIYVGGQFGSLITKVLPISSRSASSACGSASSPSGSSCGSPGGGCGRGLQDRPRAHTGPRDRIAPRLPDRDSTPRRHHPGHRRQRRAEFGIRRLHPCA